MSFEMCGKVVCCRCFDRFFKAVNSKENKLIPKRRAFLMDDLELIGLDYIWRLVLCSNEDIAIRAIDLLKETFTNLGPRLQANQVDIHEDFISSCMDRLKASYDTVTVLEKDKDSPGKLSQELTRLCRVLKVGNGLNSVLKNLILKSYFIIPFRFCKSM
jgi:ubiquitin carboxyl-terminal hydrolase 9/24